ncbi:MAG: hypothetical protein AB4058_06010 [Microcystaceae cyanobacterium]
MAVNDGESLILYIMMVNGLIINTALQSIDKANINRYLKITNPSISVEESLAEITPLAMTLLVFVQVLPELVTISS